MYLLQSIEHLRHLRSKVDVVWTIKFNVWKFKLTLNTKNKINRENNIFLLVNRKQKQKQTIDKNKINNNNKNRTKHKILINGWGENMH